MSSAEFFELAGFRVGDRVTYRRDVGTVDLLIVTEEKKPRQRALVHWDSDDMQQFVDLDKLKKVCG